MKKRKRGDEEMRRKRQKAEGRRQKERDKEVE